MSTWTKTIREAGAALKDAVPPPSDPIRRARRALRGAALGLFGLLAGCHNGPDCEDNTAPEGTRFRVDVLEELPDSDGCHRLVLEAGSSFFLTAGAAIDRPRPNGPACPLTLAAGPPEAVESSYGYAGDCGAYQDSLSIQCTTTFPDLCPSDVGEGLVLFLVRAGVPPTSTSTRGEFWVEDYVPTECSQASCSDKYRIEISRVTEE